MFKFTGKADRSEWWITTTLSGIVAQLSLVFAISARMQEGGPNWIAFVTLLALALASVWVVTAVTAKRFRDCGYSPWLTFTALIPVIGELFLLVVCGLFPGAGMTKRGKRTKCKVATRVVE